MDRVLREKIVAEVRKGVQEAYETYNERWVTGKTLATYFETMTAGWLKMYGAKLPRRRSSSGTKAPWIYPLHQIQRMVSERDIELL